MPPSPLMTLAEVDAFLDREFPQFRALPGYNLAEISPGRAVLALDPDDSHLRPGATVSGPTLFTLADVGAYAVLLAHIGPVPLIVTTSMAINFMRRPGGRAAPRHLHDSQARPTACGRRCRHPRHRGHRARGAGNGNLFDPARPAVT